ncbi:sensor histidine kinase [Hymenobacter ruber]
MSGAEENEKQFVISAHVVRQLGEQLVSDEVTALIELVKNSYDADARSVSIVVDTRATYVEEDLAFAVSNPTTTPGYITLSDTGTGMDEADVTKGWLYISFSLKRGVNELGITTPKYKRAFLGSKGVGRLSAQRLGSRLDLFSLKEYPIFEAPEGSPPKWRTADIGVHVGVNWEDFQENRRLQDVPVSFATWMPDNGRPGTKLVITELQNHQIWQEPSSRSALMSTLAQLISPFEPAKSFRINLQIDNIAYDLFELTKGVRDTAISTYRFAFDGQELIIKGKAKTSLFRGNNDPALARDYQALIAGDNGANFFEFLKDAKGLAMLKPGNGTWFFEYEIRLQVASLGLDGLVASGNGDEPATLLKGANPGPFHGEIDQLVYDAADATGEESVFNLINDYKAYIRRQSGVRIYRDGFGIRPYGIDGDDWMGFQHGTTSGKSFYGLRPKNLIGYISLTAKDNGVLEEKTDREGFVLNLASRNFFTLAYKVRDEINGVLNRVRRRYNDYKDQQSVAEAEISSATEVLGRLRGTAEQVAALRQKTQQVNVEAVSTAINRKLTAIRQNPLLESGNDAALQKLLAEAQQELNKATEVINLLKQVQQELTNLAPLATFLESQLEQLNNQLSDVTELAGLGLTAEALSHEIGNVVDWLLDETKRTVDFLRQQPSTAPEVFLFTERVRSSLHALRRETQHLDPSLRYLREKREILVMSKFVEGLKEFYEGRLRFQEAGIKFIVEIAPDKDFTLFCSRGKFTQVLDNLVINSEYWLREALRQQVVTAPRIILRLNDPYLEISDNGVGLDPGIVPHLFEPFVTTKPRETGRGLGLFITRQLLESMGCSIDLLPALNRFNRPYIFRLDLTGARHG